MLIKSLQVVSIVEKHLLERKSPFIRRQSALQRPIRSSAEHHVRK